MVFLLATPSSPEAGRRAIDVLDGELGIPRVVKLQRILCTLNHVRLDAAIPPRVPQTWSDATILPSCTGPPETMAPPEAAAGVAAKRCLGGGNRAA
jgi:hypothetical protein